MAPTLEPGDSLGPYTVQALLGAGGMGEVYRAHDKRLGRDAALKVIAPKLLADPSARRRFENEARAASVLNHPAIVTIYDVGESGERSWIAMEWVEGQTLRQKLAQGRLSLSHVVAIAREIADGLAAAHDKGIVHRDLKPENIMLRADGRTKILDFGLARQTIVDNAGDSTSQAETAAATAAGAIVGTVGYMSPEQAAGKPADFRSDQFALGVILYEMLGGRRPFQGSSVVETLASILRDDPLPLSALRSDVPDSLHKVISRCLAKRPDQRFASTRELALSLESIPILPSTRSQTSAASDLPTEVMQRDAPLPLGRRRWVRAGSAAAALALLLAGAAVWTRFRGPASTVDSLAILPFENAANDENLKYLGDSMTESLIDQMSRLPAIRVMAYTTVARFKKSEDPQAVGRKLGVGTVLVGRIWKRDSELVVSSELVDVASGARLWGETYERPAADLLRVQDSMAWQIADRLRVRLSEQQKHDLFAHSTNDPQAYEQYLRGRFLLQYDTEADDAAARELFLIAIEKDPRFADAYLGVASTYARAAGNGYAQPAEAWSRAGEYARKALQHDPGNFGARVSLAVRHFLYDWDWKLAEREFGELSGDPRIFVANRYHPTSMFFWAIGRADEAIALMERALRIDPQNIESRIMLANLLGAAGRTDEAISQYTSIMREQPDDDRPYYGLADVARRRGDIAGAIGFLRKAYELSEEDVGIDALAHARTEADYDRAQISVARERLRSLEGLTRERYVSPLDLARLHVKVGNREQAFTALQQALQEKSAGLTFLRVDRGWDPIREDPRFSSVVRAVGIP